jgi:pyruvate/2-oxoglutarate dehydrogenase complex dihydrolipoamide acyltransferase (E2) component
VFGLVGLDDVTAVVDDEEVLRRAIRRPGVFSLAVGAAKPQPVAVDGAVSVATLLRCTLSVDHRAINGALAARWLAAFTQRIEHPLGSII